MLRNKVQFYCCCCCCCFCKHCNYYFSMCLCSVIWESLQRRQWCVVSCTVSH